MTQSLFSTAVERTQAWELQGPLILVTPSLACRFRLRELTAGGRVAHAFPVWDRLQYSSRPGGGTGGGDSYPLLGNGMLLEFRAAIDF